MFDTVLVANRGEVAVRIVRACHDLGLRAVVAYSTADRESQAVAMADDAICVGPAPIAAAQLPERRGYSVRVRAREPTRCTPGTGSCPRTPTSQKPAATWASSSSVRLPT
jgi:biotin carboxylase